MWNCSCGNICEDTSTTCTNCGSTRPIDKVKSFVEKIPWCLALAPVFISLLCLIFPFLGNIQAALSIGIYCSLIFADTNELKKSDISIGKWKWLGILLHPAFYLFPRAKKTDNNLKPAIVSVLITLIIIITLIPSSSKPDTSVLKEVRLDDAFEISLTEEFIKAFKEVDYRDIYNPKTDRIIIHYLSPSSTSAFAEEQYAIEYYSVRNISGEDAGYIGACAEEAAWLLWGIYDSGIRPTIWSEYKQNEGPYKCLYSFGYRNNLGADEFGDLYYNDKFSIQNWSDLEATAGPNIWRELQGTDIDPTSPAPVYEWEAMQKQAMYDSYIETRNYLNKNALKATGN